MPKELNKQSLCGLPTDDQGYFHRFGGRDIWDEADSTIDDEESKQCVLATMVFVGTLINALQICRKTQITLEEAIKSAEKWKTILPWTEQPIEYGDCVSLFTLSDFNLEWLNELPTLQLFQREDGLETLAITLIGLYEQQENTGDWSEALYITYCNYVAYGVKQLAESWDRTTQPYLAPLYHTGEVEKQSFEQWSHVFFHDYTYENQLARPFQLYDLETKETIEGYYKNGVLYSYQSQDIFRVRH